MHRYVYMFIVYEIYKKRKKDNSLHVDETIRITVY